MPQVIELMLVGVPSGKSKAARTIVLR